jgi:adenylate cyclase
MEKKVSDLIEWIIAQGIACSSISDFLAGLCQRLVDDGMPIWQASITMPSIHPTYRGFSANFTRGSDVAIENVELGSGGDEYFQQTPIFYLIDNGLLFGRWRCGQDTAPTLRTFLDPLWSAGGTDHVVRVIEFPTEIVLRGLSFSVTSDAPDGFSTEHLDVLARLHPAIGLACYRMAASKTTAEILAIYTGARTSERILSGEIERGKGTAIYAAILLVDLRDFTSLSEQYSSAEIVGFLNERFELIGMNVEKCGGEILKFMGDSALAIFPADINDPAQACLAARNCAQNILDENQSMNDGRFMTKRPNIAVDIVLHLGEVFYGNVGASGRLDFTVIGQTVNEASRLEKLCGKLGQPLLLSESFAKAAHLPHHYVGEFALRGVSKTAKVFAPA